MTATYRTTSILFVLAIGVAFNSGCGLFRKQQQTDREKSFLEQMPFSGYNSSNMRFQSPDSVSNFQQESTFGTQSDFPTTETKRPVVQEGDSKNIVRDVILRGNTTVPTHHLMRNIRTRPGRYFDPDMLQQDVNELWKMKEVQRIVGPYVQHNPDGVVVTIEVVERKLMNDIQFIGNRGITDRALLKETGLSDGSPLDVHEIKMVKHRIEEFYQEKGYPRTQVEILSGSEEADNAAVFLIHEDEQQRIWNVEFEGNAIASDARLKNFIESKPGILKVIGGLVKREEIDQDVLRLTSYYRSLGFFNARIGREIVESNNGRWLTLRFIIDEGPRYRIRNVTFVGANSFTNEQLMSMVEMTPTDEGMPEFNSARVNQDVVSVRDLYGANGFVFSKVEIETRFLEEPGYLDLVYKINEGEQYRVRNINVHIQGGSGTTRRQVVMNRVSLRPGDLIDVREIRNSERRLGGAQLFATGGPGSAGQGPKIVVKPDELKALERTARRNGGPTNR